MARIVSPPSDPQVADCSAMMRMLNPLLLRQCDSTASKRQLLADLFRLIGNRIDTTESSDPAGTRLGPAITPVSRLAPRRDAPIGSATPALAPHRATALSTSPAFRGVFASGVASHPGEPEPAMNLSPRVEQTLRCLLVGMSEKEAAHELGLSPHTVHVYVKTLYRRFHVSTRAELLARHVHQSGAPESK